MNVRTGATEPYCSPGSSSTVEASKVGTETSKKSQLSMPQEFAVGRSRDDAPPSSTTFSSTPRKDAVYYKVATSVVVAAGVVGVEHAVHVMRIPARVTVASLLIGDLSHRPQCRHCLFSAQRYRPCPIHSGIVRIRLHKYHCCGRTAVS